MTVNCTNIESVLGPLRDFKASRDGVISLHQFMQGQYLRPEQILAWSKLKWTQTGEPPVADWLENTDSATSHREFVERMQIAAFIAFMNGVPVLAEGHPWCLLDHQAAGHACYHLRFVGRPILLRPAVEAQLLELAKRWYNRQTGWGDPCLSELMEYRSQLQELEHVLAG
jgi:hypothetical protein